LVQNDKKKVEIDKNLSHIEKINIKINFDKSNVQKDLENIAQRKIE